MISLRRYINYFKYLKKTFVYLWFFFKFKITFKILQAISFIFKQFLDIIIIFLLINFDF